MGMDYSKAKDWILREDSFDPYHLGKTEAIMALGNGYMGVRSAAEERYLGETRNCLVNGTFNKADDTAVTELPNVPDMTAMEIWINNDRFTLEQGTIDSYSKELNIRTGELKREIVWTSPDGDQVSLVFYRIVSLTRLHDFVIRAEVTPLSGDITVKLNSGINGQVTNTGAQHFTDGDKRLYEGRYMQFVPVTTQSDITFVVSTCHQFFKNDVQCDVPIQIYMKLRYIYGVFETEVKKGETLAMEKYCDVYTSRDIDMNGKSQEEMQSISLTELKDMESNGYHALAEESAREWEKEIWDRVPITIEGNDYDQFAIRFAQYHMRLMVPSHDSRMNIGAKSLTGEGYKGHCFWDTEIFLLPYYMFTQPEVARRLEDYRYLSLPGAHKKAAHNGYAGAMYPWESAWLDDGEVTPEFLDVDVVTGRPNKVWTGFIEQHITSDVAFGVWQYYVITGDQDYMDKCGYELIFDTARFWVSRLEDKCRQITETLNPETNEIELTETVTEDGLYHICDVVGPDEYKEHKTDNAFTNYMAVWNIKKAIQYYDELKANRPKMYKRLNETLQLDQYYEEWKEKVNKIYLPVPNEYGVLPQDSTYLTLQDIDLSKYKAQDFIGGICRDYNMPQINEIQVSKQADVLVLFFLLEDLFPAEVKKETWKYYAERTLHDSSLSLSTHAVLAADMKEPVMAYDLFEDSTKIDLGPVMTTSDAGVHAASFGGIWQGVVYGFGGLRMLGGKLRIDPMLPKEWTKLEYQLWWRDQELQVTVTPDEVKVVNLTGKKPITINLCGDEVVLETERTHALG